MSRPRLSSRMARVLALAGTLVVLLAASRSWVVVDDADPVLGRTSTSLTGGDLSSAVVALALAALAALLVSLLAGRWVSRVGALVVTAAGLAVGVVVGQLLANPAQAVAAARDAAVQGGSTSAQGLAVSPWPWVALVGAAGVAIGGGALLVLPSGSPAPRRPARSVRSVGDGSPDGEDGSPDGEGGGVPPRPRAEDDWDRLSRGEDPTT